jgi:hypothetical protein
MIAHNQYRRYHGFREAAYPPGELPLMGGRRLPVFISITTKQHQVSPVVYRVVYHLIHGTQFVKHTRG